MPSKYKEEIHTDHRYEDLSVIFGVIGKVKPKHIVELGTYYGGFAAYLADMSAEWGGHVYTFDKEKQDTVDKVLKYCNNATFIEGNILSSVNSDIVDIISRSNAMLYCDNGNKNLELEMYAPYMKKGSIVGVHDYGTECDPEIAEPLMKRLGFKQFYHEKFEILAAEPHYPHSLTRFWYKAYPSILIIGGNRFVGKLVVERLIQDEYPYVVTVMNRSGTAPFGCEIIQCDRNNEKKLSELMDGKYFDCIIDMCLYNRKQAEITSRVFDGKTSKYIYISSIAVYKESGIFPITEDFPMGEWKLWGDYGRDKMEAENHIDGTDLPYICLRPTYIVGKGDPHRRLNNFFPGNTAIMSLVFVDDVAEIICRFVDLNISKQKYNIASDGYIKQSELMKILGAGSFVSNSNTSMVPFNNENVLISNEKIKKDLGFKFRPLKKSLKEYYGKNVS